MKCLSCDRILTDKEATRRGAITNDFIDLCDHCFNSIPDFTSYTNPNFEDENERQSED